MDQDVRRAPPAPAARRPRDEPDRPGPPAGHLAQLPQPDRARLPAADRAGAAAASPRCSASTPAFFAPHDTPRLVADLREALPTTGDLAGADLTALATKFPRGGRGGDRAVPPLPAGRRAARPRSSATATLVARPQPARAGDATSSTAGRTTCPPWTRPPRRWPPRSASGPARSPGLLRARLADRHGIRIVAPGAPPTRWHGDLHRYRPGTRTAAPVDVTRPGTAGLPDGRADRVAGIRRPDRRDSSRTRVSRRPDADSHPRRPGQLLRGGADLPYRLVPRAAERIGTTSGC